MRRARGFTLLEIIVALVLVGLLAAGITTGFVYFLGHQQSATQDYQQAQKLQLAITRITYELKNASDVTVAGNVVSYTRGEARSISLKNGKLVLYAGGADHILTDNVSAMTANYADRMATMTFTTKLADGQTTTTTLAVYA